LNRVAEVALNGLVFSNEYEPSFSDPISDC